MDSVEIERARIVELVKQKYAKIEADKKELATKKKNGK